MNLRALVAEFLGVFALCFVGIGAIAATQGGDWMAIALAHGLAIGLSMVALGTISGGHFNPAVTFAMLITGRMTPVGAVGYWVAQLLGGLVAAFFIGAIYGGTAVADGTPAPSTNHTAIQALMMEVFLTFFLASVFFASAVFNNFSFAGLAVGLAVTMDILAGGAVSGAAMNPARVLGPAIIGGEWAAHWVYWVGPLVGAGLAALLYDFLYSKQVES
ncbi:MIP/aquaporin family protein [Meiothermus taiwanensis]|uniref:Aquaporin Z n=2 Tax=Meiothermus taiwanensis TaxID=172827 RepID=A0A399E8W5_9DEIN|nr:aquaporin [Meiothermus taiwanensis]AWR87474.1 major intrinsic protein [Meiothermus taiwanensis WR-220]KIQ56064.1 MIP family channel protein [Meiothermus taiwanensis]KZK16200.1 aquaporin [Meiothermus taiwanensis]RIH78482.1 Aquaporin Z [Meiothermus taiwanensis]